MAAIGYDREPEFQVDAVNQPTMEERINSVLKDSEPTRIPLSPVYEGTRTTDLVRPAAGSVDRQRGRL